MHELLHTSPVSRYIEHPIPAANQPFRETGISNLVAEHFLGSRAHLRYSSYREAVQGTQEYSKELQVALGSTSRSIFLLRLPPYAKM